MFCPAVTGSGESVFVTIRSARVFTVVVAVAALSVASGSVVLLETFAVLEIDAPFAALVFTLTTSVNVPDAFAARLAFEQEIVPVAPTAGVVQLKPAGLASETKVVFVGTASVNVTLVALLGPVFVTMIE